MRLQPLGMPFGMDALVPQRQEVEIDIPQLRIDENDPYRDQYAAPAVKEVDARHLLIDEYDPKSVLTPKQISKLVGMLRSAAGTGLSLLATAASVIDKVPAGIRGTLAGDLSQWSLILPFSESYLKNFYEKNLGIKIPDHHITGREVLERWGFPKNQKGFDPINNTADALLDAAGIALEIVAVPPLFPRIGALTKAGHEAYRLGEAGVKISRLENVLREAGEMVGRETLTTKMLASVTGPLEAKVSSILLNADVPQDVIDYAVKTISSMPRTAKVNIHRKIMEAVSDGDAKSIGRIIANIPEYARLLSPTEKLGHMPAVSMAGRAQELKQGLRGIVLEPVWPFGGLFDRIEIKAPALGKAMQAASETQPVAWLRGLFDWSVKDAGNKIQQIGTQRAVESVRNMLGSARDIMFSTKTYLGAVADRFAREYRLAQLAGNNAATMTYEQALAFIAEHSRKLMGSIDDRAHELAKVLLNGQTPPQSLVETISEISSVIERNLVDTIDFMHGTVRQLGLDIPKTSPIFHEYFPRYTRQTPLGDTAFKRVGEPLVTASETRKLKRRTFALKHVPGGQVMTNAVMQDLILTRPAGRSLLAARPGESYVYKLPNGKVFTYGDFVARVDDTGNAIVGRVTGVDPATGDITVMLTSGKKAVFKESEILRSYGATPTESGVFGLVMTRLTKEQQLSAARQWLELNGIAPVPVKKSRDSVKLLQQYMYHRYFEPVIDSLTKADAIENPDLARFIFYNDGKNIPYKRQEIVRMVQQYFGVNQSEARRIANVALTQGGLSSELVKYARGHKPRPLFSNDILADHYRYISTYADVASALSGLHEVFMRTILPARSAVPNAFRLPDASRTEIIRSGYTTLADAWSRIVVPFKPAGGKLYSGTLSQEGLQTLLTRLEKEGPQQIRDAIAAAKQAGKDPAEMLVIPRSVTKTAQSMLKLLMPQSEERLFLEDAVRSYLGTVATWMTLPRIAFHTRNFISNVAMSLMGEKPFTNAEYMEALKRYLPKILKGKIEDIPYIDEVLASGIASPSGKMQDIALNTAATNTLLFGKQISREAEKIGLGSVAEALAAPAKEYLSPKNIFTYRGTTHPLVKAGQRAFNTVEAATRIPLYVLAREKGLTHSQAKDIVEKILYDYTRLSGFEKRYMQPTIMFYSWLRQNLGYMIPRVTLDWASGPAQATRIIGRFWQSSGEVLPTWLQDSLGIPVYRDNDGQVVVIKSLGLPMQDLAIISPNLAKVQSQMYARANPIIKAAYILATGKDPFTGIPVTTYKSVAERIAKEFGIDKPTPEVIQKLKIPYRVMEQLIPAVPFVAQFAKAADPTIHPVWRAIDLTTGINLGKYNVERAALLEAADNLRKSLIVQPGVREFQVPYVTEEASAGTQQTYDLYKAVESFLRKYKQQQEQTLQLPYSFAPSQLQ